MTEIYKYRDGQKLTVDEQTMRDFCNSVLKNQIEEGSAVQNVTGINGKQFQIVFGKAKGEGI